MDVTDHDPSLVPAPAPVPVLELLQDDEVQRTDIRLVTRSVEDHMVAGVCQGVTFTDQAAPAPAHVLVHPFDVVLQTDLRPEGVLQVILGEDMAVADLEVTPFGPAALAHDPSLIRAHARCHTQAIRDILEAAAVPDQSAGQGEVAAVMTSGIVDLDHPKLDDMASGKIFDIFSVARPELMSSLYTVCIFRKYLRCKAACIVLLPSNC